MKNKVLLATSLLFSLLLMGCNTMEGLGQDIEKGGEAIKEAANNAKS